MPLGSTGKRFNGGTITTPLDIDQGASAASDGVLLVTTTGGETALRVTPDGQMTLFSGGTRQEATLVLTDDTPGNAGQLQFDTFSGVNLQPEAGTATVLQVVPRAGHTGAALAVLATTGENTLAVSADNKLGFFDHAPAARPAAPVTLGDVIAALKALGLVAT